MTFRDNYRSDSSAPKEQPLESAPEVLIAVGWSAISGPVVGFLLAGNAFASVVLIITALLAGWIGWWARGLV